MSDVIVVTKVEMVPVQSKFKHSFVQLVIQPLKKNQIEKIMDD